MSNHIGLAGGPWTLGHAPCTTYQRTRLIACSCYIWTIGEHPQQHRFLNGLLIFPSPRSVLTTMYDKTPVYPHQQHLTWAHEPLKSIYVFQRLFTTILIVPLWIIYYTLLPRSFRPRTSWSLTQIVVVKFTKRIYKVTEVAGVTWGTRDPTQEPDHVSLKETRFAWVPPLPDELRTGVVDDNEVQCLRVGTFIWPKVPSSAVRMRGVLGGGGSAAELSYPQKYIPDNVPAVASQLDAVKDCATPASQYTLPKLHKLDTHLPEVLHTAGDADVEADAVDSPPHIIGIYLHGGGYCHMSAHESSGTSRIPRRLMKVRVMSNSMHLCDINILNRTIFLKRFMVRL
jgi:hypothetical protein